MAATVPPFLFAQAGTFAAPFQYEVPASGEVQPYTASATYTNASGQAILPALRLKSASGNLLALTFPVGQTIADGSASEVTFVPPFGSASGSGSTPTATVADWCWMQSTSTTSPLAFTHFTSSSTAVFSTSTSGAPTVVSNTSGDQNLMLRADGIYLVWQRAQITNTVSATERWLNFNPTGNVAPITLDASLAWGDLAFVGVPVMGWFNSNFVAGGSGPGLVDAHLIVIDSSVSGGVKYCSFGLGTLGTISAVNFDAGAYYWPADVGSNLY